MSTNFNQPGSEGSEPLNNSARQTDNKVEETEFEKLYPAIQGDWGLPNDIPNSPPNWMNADSHAELEQQLREVKEVDKVPIGSSLAEYIAKWSIVRIPRKSIHGTDEWTISYFRRALKNRVPQFVQWAIDHPSPESDLAVKGVRMIYDLRWPHNASTGYIFHILWGWLQLELHKPGESKPATFVEQMEFLEADAKKNGKKVVGWHSLGGGGVMAITAPIDKVYPEIKGRWGLPRDIPHTVPDWMNVDSLDELESQLNAVDNVAEVPIGELLAEYIAKWTILTTRNKYLLYDLLDWEPAFLKRALKGRVPEFVRWAIDHPSPASDLAVKGIRKIYDKHWRLSPISPLYYAAWSWLQVELIENRKNRAFCKRNAR